jgi:alpha-methylacyl-CoA racemase
MPIHKNIMNRNKKCVTIDLKNKEHFQLIKLLISKADIIIDPYRPGVLEKLKLGPKDLFEINKRAILLRVSGYGQNGPLALRPGHDLNYLSVGGIIPLINKEG